MTAAAIIIIIIAILTLNKMKMNVTATYTIRKIGMKREERRQQQRVALNKLAAAFSYLI
jgi:hypothetical protein